MLDNVDYTRKTADDGGDVMADPMLRALKRILPYHSLWQDPVKVKEFHDGLLSAMNTGPDEAKGATEEEVSRLRQTRERKQRFRTDARIPTGASGKDHEFLDDPEQWNSTRRL